MEGLWEHPAQVGKTVGELTKFAELRGLICHGLIKNATLHGAPAFSIEAPGLSDWRERQVLLVTECQHLIDGLSKLTDRLRKQRLKPRPPSA